MLVDLQGKKIKLPVGLTREQMQFLVDSEVFWAGLGIGFKLMCPKKCRQPLVGDFKESEGLWTMTCECRVLEYRGHDIVPPKPPSLAYREPLPDGSKRADTLTRYDRQMIANFETVVLSQLKLPYRLYCLRCMARGLPGGIYGKQKDESNSWIGECDCTVRTYRDAGGHKPH